MNWPYPSSVPSPPQRTARATGRTPVFGGRAGLRAAEQEGRVCAPNAGGDGEGGRARMRRAAGPPQARRQCGAPVPDERLTGGRGATDGDDQREQAGRNSRVTAVLGPVPAALAAPAPKGLRGPTATKCAALAAGTRGTRRPGPHGRFPPAPAERASHGNARRLPARGAPRPFWAANAGDSTPQLWHGRPAGPPGPQGGSGRSPGLRSRARRGLCARPTKPCRQGG